MMKVRYLLFLLSFIIFACSKKVTKVSPVLEGEIIEADEIRAENLVSDGIDYYKSNEFHKAVTVWKKALKIIPDDAEVNNFVGLAYYKLGKLDSAIIYYKKAVELNPVYYQAWNNLGYMYFLKSDYLEALKYFNKALEANPYYDQAILNRDKTKEIVDGKLSMMAFELFEETTKLDSLEIQIRNYRRILKIDSNYVDAWNNLGVAYYYFGNVDSAVYCIKKALDKNPDYAPAHNNAAYILDGLGKYNEAIAYYQKAIKLRPNYIVAMANLVDSYMHKKDYESAKRILEVLRRLQPDSILVRQRMEEFHQLLNDN